MAMHLARLCALGNFGHVAADAVGKGVNRMCRGLVQLDMAFETLLGAGADRLGPGRRQADLMNVMTGGTGDPFGHML